VFLVYTPDLASGVPVKAGIFLKKSKKLVYVSLSERKEYGNIFCFQIVLSGDLKINENLQTDSFYYGLHPYSSFFFLLFLVHVT
jgi:hypothetical protein